MKPYFADESVALYLGDMREVVPSLPPADLVVADPPYDSTPLPWDRWPEGWPAMVAESASAMWCFGTLRMFMDHADEFRDAGWKLAQDIVWEKHNGSGLQADRFRRVHEQAVQFYRGPWGGQHRAVPTTPDATPRTVRRKALPPQHQGARGPSIYSSVDGGPRLMRSVIRVRSMHGMAVHPTEKPLGILTPLIEYSSIEGGVVYDPFMGAGSTLVAAKMLGRHAVGVDVDERWCEAAARRCSQEVLGLSA